MGRECIKVQIEPITGKERNTARGEDLSQRVDEQVRHVLGARTQLEHRQKLGARIDGQPQKDAAENDEEEGPGRAESLVGIQDVQKERMRRSTRSS